MKGFSWNETPGGCGVRDFLCNPVTRRAGSRASGPFALRLSPHAGEESESFREAGVRARGGPGVCFPKAF